MAVRFHDSLTPLLTPIDEIHQHPDNPNATDLDPIIESIQVNGFTAPLIVQKSTRHILAGNHRWQALHALGATHAPVVWVDLDDTHAMRYLLADNRTTRLGRDDDTLVARILTELATTPEALAGTGYTPDDLAALTIQLDEIAKHPGMLKNLQPTITHALMVHCDDEPTATRLLAILEDEPGCKATHITL